jgi:hypothetical protein
MTSISEDTLTNERMARVLPELASEYAQFPMRYSSWLSPSATGPKGEPCFLVESSIEDATKNSDSFKELVPDYAYAKRGPFGPGYYHLLTKVAYTALYEKLRKNPPALSKGLINFPFRLLRRRNEDSSSTEEASNRKSYAEDYAWTKAIIQKRHEASRPNIVAGPAAARVDATGGLKAQNPRLAHTREITVTNSIPTVSVKAI